MHPKLKTCNVAIYARCAAGSQGATIIESQVRQCRAFIAHAGGDPSRAAVFSDCAVSGMTADRPGLASMMAAVDAGHVGVIVTQDLSRITRESTQARRVLQRLAGASLP